jgi:ArsR family transcriptional regulator, arsenate/arsenite/antimonite-responsive transcriptional repressor
MNSRRPSSFADRPEGTASLPGMSAADEVALATLAKALGHPARVRILRFLLSRDACMCGEINKVIPLAQSTVSQHLKVLKEAGLIVGEIDGPRVCYSPAPAAVAELRRLVGRL